MPFGMVGWMGPGMRQVVGIRGRSMGDSNLGANVGLPTVINGEFAALCSLFPNYFGQSCCFRNLFCFIMS